MFDYFPKINYELNGKAYPVVDILKRVRIYPDSLNSLFLEQDIVDTNERPDTISTILYDNPAYDWTVMQASGVKNPSADWVINSQVFGEYIEKKYPNEVVILDSNYFTQQKLITPMEQFLQSSENVFILTQFAKNVSKLERHLTPHLDISEVNTFLDLGTDDSGNTYSKTISAFLKFLDHPNDDWFDTISDFSDEIDIICDKVNDPNDPNIQFFKRELNRFKQTLLDLISPLNSYVGNNSFFISDEIVKGVESGTTAVVKEFNPNVKELILKDRVGDFKENEIVRGKESHSQFVYISDNYQPEYNATYGVKSSDSIGDLKYYSYTFTPSISFQVGEKCEFGNGEHFTIDSLPGGNIIFSDATMFPVVGTIFIGNDSGSMAVISSITPEKKITYSSLPINTSDSVIVSSLEDIDNISSFNDNIIAYGVINESSILDIEGLSEISGSKVAKIGKVYGILENVEFEKEVDLQTNIYVVEPTSYLQYEIDRNSTNQNITYLKPEAVEAYIEQFIEVIGS